MLAVTLLRYVRTIFLVSLSVIVCSVTGALGLFQTSNLAFHVPKSNAIINKTKDFAHLVSLDSAHEKFDV